MGVVLSTLKLFDILLYHMECHYFWQLKLRVVFIPQSHYDMHISAVLLHIYTKKLTNLCFESQRFYVPAWPYHKGRFSVPVKYITKTCESSVLKNKKLLIWFPETRLFYGFGKLYQIAEVFDIIYCSKQCQIKPIL